MDQHPPRGGGGRILRSCILKASMVECRSIPLIDTLNQLPIDPRSTLDQYLISTSFDTRLTWFIECRPSDKWVLIKMLIERLIECWLKIDRGYRSTLTVDALSKHDLNTSNCLCYRNQSNMAYWQTKPQNIIIKYHILITLIIIYFFIYCGLIYHLIGYCNMNKHLPSVYTFQI